MQCDFKHLGIEIFSSLPIVITSESRSNSGTCKSKLQILSWLFVEGNWLRRWEECFGRWVNKYWGATWILFLMSHNHYIHTILFGLDWIGRKKMTTHHTAHKKKIGTIFVYFPAQKIGCFGMMGASFPLLNQEHPWMAPQSIPTHWVESISWWYEASN